MSMFQTENSNVQARQSSNKIIYCIATFTAITFLIDRIGCLVSTKVIKTKLKICFDERKSKSKH